MNNLKSLIKLILLISLVLSVEFSEAQQGPCPDGSFPPCGKGPPPPPGLPIDGGISFLVLSGVIYGVYETLKRR